MVGIFIERSSANTIGGVTGVATGVANRNVIASNTDAGIQLAGGDGNRVIGNYIGTTTDGEDARANRVGVLVTGGTNTTIGGETAMPGSGAGNLISGNRGRPAESILVRRRGRHHEVPGQLDRGRGRRHGRTWER